MSPEVGDKDPSSLQRLQGKEELQGAAETPPHNKRAGCNAADHECHETDAAGHKSPVPDMSKKGPGMVTPLIYEKEEASGTLGQWSPSIRVHREAETRWEWDASLLSTEELNARLQKKVEGIVKRERALAYATSHQLPKTPTRLPPSSLKELKARRSTGWWTFKGLFQMGQSAKERAATPLAKANAPTWEQAGRHRRSPRFGHENHMMNWEGSCHLPLRDDESLTSCPAFTVPSYMAPTLSARAKVKDYKFYKESPKVETKKRFSFGLTQNIETLKWKKSSQPATKESNHQIIRGKHRMTNSLGSLSVESTASLPVGIRRKPFE